MNRSNNTKRKRQDDNRRTNKTNNRVRPKSTNNDTHRFGRVMHQPPKLQLHPRQDHDKEDAATSSKHKVIYPTVSIAIPGSVICNAQTRELQTALAGAIARAAAVYRVDEIVVFDDGLGSVLNTLSNYRRGPSSSKRDNTETKKEQVEEQQQQQQQQKQSTQKKREQPSTDPHAFLARILQYCECPQYLRRKFFPMHPDLQFAGLLPPLDMPHHLRRYDVLSYREGVVMEDGTDGGNQSRNDGEMSLVDCGVPNNLVRVDRKIPPGIRCTVKIDPKSYPPPHSNKKGVMKGTVVSPATPRDEEGMYWGYTTRLASSINAIFEECPYEGGYDMKVGTSERGDVSIDDDKFCLKRKAIKGGRAAARTKNDNNDDKFDHLLIVFGGVAGIEESVDADESMTLSGEDSKKMFDVWVNICPYQGSRTIRTEEAVMITLSRLSPFIAKNALSSEKSSKPDKMTQQKAAVTEDIVFSDAAVSDESSEEDEE